MVVVVVVEAVGSEAALEVALGPVAQVEVAQSALVMFVLQLHQNPRFCGCLKQIDAFIYLTCRMCCT